MDRGELNKAIVGDWRLVNRAMDRVVLPALITRDITMAQFKALIAVSGAGEAGISITELGGELSIGQPSASLIVDQLERHGYAVRKQDTDDRRRVLVCATTAGEEIVTELRNGRRSTFTEWLAQVSDEDAAALAKGLGALAAGVIAVREAPKE